MSGMCQSKMRGKLFLSTMLNLNDAAYCVQHGAGAGMIQLGTMLAVPESDEMAPYRQRWPKAFLPRGEAAMGQFLADELAVAQAGLGDVPVCLSIGGFDVEELVPAARAFAQVGGPCVELNAHGGLKPWSEQGYLGGMALPAYRDRLIAWVERLAEVDVPLIVKFNTHFEADFAQIVHQLAHVPLAGFHFNVRDDERKQPQLDFIRAMRDVVPGQLWVSGYAWTAKAVRSCLDAGADAVGVAQPVMKDPQFIAGLAAEVG